MNYDIRVSQPLPLDGAKNVRDLGGYPAKDGYYMFQSKPEDMEKTIRYFREKYTDAENYLTHFCKCSKDDVEWIRNRLLKNI